MLVFQGVQRHQHASSPPAAFADRDRNTSNWAAGPAAALLPEEWTHVARVRQTRQRSVNGLNCRSPYGRISQCGELGE